MEDMEVVNESQQCLDVEQGVWSDVIEQHLINLMIEEVKRGNTTTTTFSNTGWNKIQKGLKEKFGKDYTVSQLKNKYNQLRQRQRSFKMLIGETGMGYNSSTGKVTAIEERWKDLYKATMDSFQEEKVKKFEEFVDHRLKPDLVHAIAERDKAFEQQKVFSDLRRNIENLEKNSVSSLRTLVSLGSEVYLQADVPDTRHIFVDIGLGFHVEFTCTEALNFISMREKILDGQIKEYTRLIASIKAQIKMVCEGIRELLQLPADGSL